MGSLGRGEGCENWYRYIHIERVDDIIDLLA